jgi:hypothetical protein
VPGEKEKFKNFYLLFSQKLLSAGVEEIRGERRGLWAEPWDGVSALLVEDGRNNTRHKSIY